MKHLIMAALAATIGLTLVSCSGDAGGGKPAAPSGTTASKDTPPSTTEAKPNETKPDAVASKTDPSKPKPGELNGKPLISPKAKPGKPGEVKTPETTAKPKPLVKHEKSGDPAKFVGSYELAMDKKMQDMNKELQSKGKNPIAGSLDIRADGTFSMSFGTTSHPMKGQGTCQATADKIILSPEQTGGPLGSRRMVLKLSADGKSLTALPEDPDTGKKIQGLKLNWKRK